MRVSQQEVQKFKLLNNKLNTFYALDEELHFCTKVADKMTAIIMSSSAKITKCTAKLLLNARDPNQSRWDGTEYVLTREGIKETFGYTGDFKARLIAGNRWFTEYVKCAKAQAGLIKLLNDPKINNPDALKLHVQAMNDIANLNLENESYCAHSKGKYLLTVFGDIEGDQQDESIQTDEILLDTANSYSSHSIEIVEQGSTKSVSHWNRTRVEGTIITYFTKDAPFKDFLRVSEEPTFTRLIECLDEHIAICKAKIQAQDKKINEVLEKYGQFLVYKEL